MFDVSTGAQHITEIYYDATMAVDYLKCYSNNSMVNCYNKKESTTIFMSEFHVFGLSQKGTLIKYDFTSIDYLSLFGLPNLKDQYNSEL